MTGPVIEVADPETGELVTLPGLPALPGATPLGLDLPPSLTWDQWSAYGATLQVAHRSIMWLLGDWLRYGADRWPDRYTQAVEATGRDVQTLRNAAWVAGRIPPAGRHPGVSWSHHAEVAALEPAERNDLLGWTANMVATRGELRAEIERRGLRQPRIPAAAGNPPETAVEGDEPSFAQGLSSLQSSPLSADLAAWLAAGRALAARVRWGEAWSVADAGVEAPAPGEDPGEDDLCWLLQVIACEAEAAEQRRAA